MVQTHFAFQFLETRNAQAFSFHQDRIMADLREMFISLTILFTHLATWE